VQLSAGLDVALLCLFILIAAGRRSGGSERPFPRFVKNLRRRTGGVILSSRRRFACG